jgi:hypothetical protein
LQRTQYARLTLDEIDAAITSLEMLPGYYDWQHHCDYPGSPNLPILMGLRDRLAQVAQDAAVNQVETPTKQTIFQPALFSLTGVQVVDRMQPVVTQTSFKPNTANQAGASQMRSGRRRAQERSTEQRASSI